LAHARRAQHDEENAVPFWRREQQRAAEAEQPVAATGPMSATAALNLQRAAGNRAVSRLVATGDAPAVQRAVDDLDHTAGLAVPPKKVKGHETDDLGEVRLNPLWVPLDEFSGRDLDNSPEGAKWQYAVTEDGEISLGSEDVASLIPRAQLDRLLAGMRTKQPGLSAEDLSTGLENMGHPTIAARFGPDGKTARQPKGRVCGELYRIGGVWTINDKSGRFMAEKVRGKPDAEELERWLSGVAQRIGRQTRRRVSYQIMKHAPA
jgi:hypothetical protein